jgi:hypothetical protein
LTSWIAAKSRRIVEGKRKAGLPEGDKKTDFRYGVAASPLSRRERVAPT